MEYTIIPVVFIVVMVVIAVSSRGYRGRHVSNR